MILDLHSARGRARILSMLAALGLVVLGALLVVEILAFGRVRDMNAAIERGAVDALVREKSPLGLFAQGYVAQRHDRLDEAVDHYSRAAQGGDSRLREVLHFNLANLYLARAVVYETGELKPLMISLIEQAKQNYREVLAHNPGHWPSRYNLSRALELLPDLADVQYGEEVNPERAPQAPRADDVYERLP